MENKKNVVIGESQLKIEILFFSFQEVFYLYNK